MINKILNMIKNGKFLIKLMIKVIWNKKKIKMMHKCWGIKVKIINKNKMKINSNQKKIW